MYFVKFEVATSSSNIILICRCFLQIGFQFHSRIFVEDTIIQGFTIRGVDLIFKSTADNHIFDSVEIDYHQGVSDTKFADCCHEDIVLCCSVLMDFDYVMGLVLIGALQMLLESVFDLMGFQAGSWVQINDKLELGFKEDCGEMFIHLGECENTTIRSLFQHESDSLPAASSHLRNQVLNRAS